jgi:diacylglycerol kinase family enzyme
MSTTRSVLFTNAHAGGASRIDALVAQAGALGIGVVTLHRGESFTQVIEAEVAKGAELLVCAGGDGTLTAVADVAMAHDLPMLPLPFGTRNHFALDLGLNLEDPVSVLGDSLSAGVERRVDVGRVNGMTFLNNVSIGFYGAAVQNDDYRNHKMRRMVREAGSALTAKHSATISTDLPDGVEVREPVMAVLVVNNPYAPADSYGGRLRPTLDSGSLWIYLIGGSSAGKLAATRAVGMMHNFLTSKSAEVAWSATRQVFTADPVGIPFAIDGEAQADASQPLELTIQPKALSLVVPRIDSLAPGRFTLTW